MESVTKSIQSEGSVQRERRESGRVAPAVVDPSSPTDEPTNTVKAGLLNLPALTALVLWYLFSAGTLFLNKYILSFLGSEPTLLGTSQITTTTILGSLQIYFGIGVFRSPDKDDRPPHFFRNMIILGGMRISTVLLGLVSLKFVAVSFTETVKGSAPVFTVFVSRLMLGEYTGLYTVFSLIPIMGGLVLCSTYELSFNLIGFMAALLTNITDCVQNVFSKRLMSGESYKYTPLQLQFYTSLASIAVQLPLAAFTLDLDAALKNLDNHLIFILVLDGICFHCQSLAAYVLMDFISPVTHSVANTVKRAMLIWSSVLIFENQVTFLSGVGTVLVSVGVLFYLKARLHDKAYLRRRVELSRQMNGSYYKIV